MIFPYGAEEGAPLFAPGRYCGMWPLLTSGAGLDRAGTGPVGVVGPSGVIVVVGITCVVVVVVVVVFDDPTFEL